MKVHGVKTPVSLLCIFLTFSGALLVCVGCGGGQEGSEKEGEKASTTAEETSEKATGGETTGGGTTGGTTGASNGEITGGTSVATGAEKPYAAIVVPDDETSRSGPSGDVLVEGAEDLSDGPLKENRIVAYYGNPLEGAMGVLGETDPKTMMENLIEQTAAYSAADPDRPAVPTIEFIASTAQRDPGSDGSFIQQLPEELIEEYATLAEENGALLLLDVQLGTLTVPEEIEVLREFLERPYVHLAIDTEYSVDPGQVPGVDLGTVDGAEIQEAVAILDQLVEEEGIPDKMLVVHQFESGIVTNKQLIEPTENVQVVLNADGFGLVEAKTTKYDVLVAEEPIQYGGFKLFYSQDPVLISPEEVLQLDPVPVVINYQ